MSTVEDTVTSSSSASRPGGETPSVGQRRNRSRITNGNVLIPGVDQRSTWVRRCRDIISEHVSDLGGVDNISAAERSIIRRASVITVQLERYERRFAEADAANVDVDAADLDLYGRMASTLRRLLEAIGLQRRARDVGPRLVDILQEGETP